MDEARTETTNPLIESLRDRVSGELVTDADTLEANAHDFGRLEPKRPGAVLRPADPEDVAAALKEATASGVPVASRGASHTQTGQSLTHGGLLLDLRSLDAIGEIREHDDSTATIAVGAGCAWEKLVAHTTERGWIPPVLTNNLFATVGGTLSTAGLGVASWCAGTQADNLAGLEVVTGAGDVVDCSPDTESQVFDAVRATLGQLGVITEARLRLRRCKPKVRTFMLLYDDLATLRGDFELLMARPEGPDSRGGREAGGARSTGPAPTSGGGGTAVRTGATGIGSGAGATGRAEACAAARGSELGFRFDYLESWCSPCPQGMKSMMGQRQPFAEWFFPLHASTEFDPEEGEPDPDSLLDGLSYYRHVATDDLPVLKFSTRVHDLFDLWKLGGFWDWAHPWMEVVLPWEASVGYISQVLSNLPPHTLVGGHILLWPARNDTCAVPYFMRPEGELVMGWGILPAVRPDRLEMALPRLQMASQMAIAAGGKRYLSGYIAFDQAAWRAHFGDRWDELCSLKKKLDPAGILNPGFIAWE